MGAVEKKEGPCVVLAGAGTGKTYTIVEKVKYLVKNKVYSPEKIVCITFSNEAANNLLSRIQRELELGDESPVVDTFHGFSANLLRRFGDRIGVRKDFKILEPDDAKVVLHRYLKIAPYYCREYIGSIGTAKDLGISFESLEKYYKDKTKDLEGVDIDRKLEDLQLELQTLHLRNEKVNKKEISSLIDKYKRIIDLRKFINAWRAYERLKDKKNYQDYSDLNNNALKLLRKFPEIANDFDYVIVDEFQDTNKVQLDFLFRLAYHRNITIVGDLNQSIYRFRGAYRRNFSDFKNHFNVDEKEVFELDKSYRSTNRILKASSDLILKNYKNKEDFFIVKNAFGYEGDKIDVYELADSKEEARKVVEVVKSEIDRGVRPNEICILFRNHGYGRVIRQALDSAGMAYSSVARESLLKNGLIKSVIDYLTILNCIANDRNGGHQAWWDLIYQLNFSEEDLIKIGIYLKENKREERISKKLFSEIDGLDLSESGKMAAKVLVGRINSILPFAEKRVTEIISKLYSVLDIVDEDKNISKEITSNLSKFYDLAKKHSELYDSDLSSFIHYLDILNSLGIEIESTESRGDGVSLMTLHATKGLEYKTVIITNMVQNRFPMVRYSRNNLIPTELNPEFKSEKILDYNLEDYVAEYEKKQQMYEERRLCYVAFTRAKEKLVITYAREYGGRKHGVSDFLKEINFKENSDINYVVDLSRKFEEPNVVIKPASAISLMLNSRNFEDRLSENVKRSKRTFENKIFSVEKNSLSPSSLLLFDECQKKFEYKYVYNMPEEKIVAWEAVRLGSFVHSVLEKGVKEGFSSLKEFIDYALELKMQEEWDSVDFSEAEYLIKVFFERNRRKYGPKSRTEQFLKMKIAGLNFVGFADRIDRNEDGLEIIDYKTSKSNVAPKNRNWQLGYYALAASNLGWGRVKKVTLDMLKLEKPLEFELDDKGNAVSQNGRMKFNVYEVEEELVRTAHRLVEAYNKGFKPCPLEKNCEFCNEYIYKV